MRLYRICFLVWGILLFQLWSFSQQVKNVPNAFNSLNQDPELILIDNSLKVPTEGGHLQGVQVVEFNEMEKLLISGSSLHEAYLLQADLKSKNTDRLIQLMEEPFRHAGGFQVSARHLAVGIEDNHLRTVSKVNLYQIDTSSFELKRVLTVFRKGEAELKTAGATGLLARGTDFLMMVANWNSRNWDFYQVDPASGIEKMISSFKVPDTWPAYQSINFIRDDQNIYAIGLYQQGKLGIADLILVSQLDNFDLIMQKIQRKEFNCTNDVDFSTAAGLQVDRKGKLHIWATQRDAVKKISVNRFSQR